MGDANCPSDEQLQGIVDINDPCQAQLPLPGSTTANNPALLPQVSTTPTPQSCPAGSTCTFITGVPNTAVYTLVGIIASFMLLSAMSGGGSR